MQLELLLPLNDVVERLGLWARGWLSLALFSCLAREWKVEDRY
jgi:hypothetical protein